MCADAAAGRRQNWRLFLVGCVGLVVASCSLYLSYGMFTSEPWYWSFGAYPVGPHDAFKNVGAYREFFRLISTIALFFIVQGALLRRNSGFAAASTSVSVWLYSGPEGTISKRVKVGVSTIVAAIVLHHIVVGPILLRQSFTGIGDFGTSGFSGRWSWRAYWVPYLLYLPYSIVQFGMIALSTWLALLRSASRDRGWFDRYLSERRAVAESQIGTQAQLETWVILARHRRAAMDSDLQDLMKPYAAIIVCVALALFAELYLGIIETLICPVQVITRIVAWMFIAVSATYFAVRLRRRTKQIAELDYDSLRERFQIAVSRNWNDVARLLDAEMQKARASELQQVRQFLEIARSRTIVAPAVAIILTSMLGVVVKQDAAGGRKVKEAVNRLAPPGVDYVALRIIESLDFRIFTGIKVEQWEYHACFSQKTSAREVNTWAAANGISVLPREGATGQVRDR